MRGLFRSIGMTIIACVKQNCILFNFHMLFRCMPDSNLNSSDLIVAQLYFCILWYIYIYIYKCGTLSWERIQGYGGLNNKSGTRFALLCARLCRWRSTLINWSNETELKFYTCNSIAIMCLISHSAVKHKNLQTKPNPL